MLALLLALPTMAKGTQDIKEKLNKSFSVETVIPQEKVMVAVFAGMREYLQEACTKDGKLDTKNALKVFMDKMYIDEKLEWPKNLADIVYADHAVSGETVGSGLCEDMMQVQDDRFLGQVLVNFKKCQITEAFFTEENRLAVAYQCFSNVFSASEERNSSADATEGQVATPPAHKVYESDIFGTMVYNDKTGEWDDHVLEYLAPEEYLCTEKPEPELTSFYKKLKAETVHALQKQMKKKSVKMEALRQERQQEQEALHKKYF